MHSSALQGLLQPLRCYSVAGQGQRHGVTYSMHSCLCASETTFLVHDLYLSPGSQSLPTRGTAAEEEEEEGTDLLLGLGERCCRGA